MAVEAVTLLFLLFPTLASAADASCRVLTSEWGDDEYATSGYAYKSNESEAQYEEEPLLSKLATGLNNLLGDSKEACELPTYQHDQVTLGSWYLVLAVH